MRDEPSAQRAFAAFSVRDGSIEGIAGYSIVIAALPSFVRALNHVTRYREFKSGLGRTGQQLGQAGDFTSGRAFVQHPFFGSFVDDRLSDFELGFGVLRQVLAHGLTNLFDYSPNTGFHRAIAKTTRLVLPRAFERRFMIGHVSTPFSMTKWLTFKNKFLYRLKKSLSTVFGQKTGVAMRPVFSGPPCPTPVGSYVER
jgi:hypothetical protein